MIKETLKKIGIWFGVGVITCGVIGGIYEENLMNKANAEMREIDNKLEETKQEIEYKKWKEEYDRKQAEKEEKKRQEEARKQAEKDAKKKEHITLVKVENAFEIYKNGYNTLYIKNLGNRTIDEIRMFYGINYGKEDYYTNFIESKSILANDKRKLLKSKEFGDNGVLLTFTINYFNIETGKYDRYSVDVDNSTGESIVEYYDSITRNKERIN